MTKKAPKPCGTYAAYQRHNANGETPCDRCEAARASYMKSFKLRQKQPGYQKHALNPCGTNAAFRRHIERGETPCEACRRVHREYEREHARKKHTRSRKLQQIYGITIDEKIEILAAQGGVCAIGILCGGAPLKEWDAKVDHSHDSNDARASVRGVLCAECNMLIGRLGDDILSIRRAFKMIETYLTDKVAATQAVLRKESTMETNADSPTMTQYPTGAGHGLLG